MKKTKKILSGIMAVCFMGFCVPYVNAVMDNSVITASAEATVPAGLTFVGKGSEGDFSCGYYSDGTLSLDGYSGTSTVVNIPEYINGKKVRSLMVDFFYYYGVNITDIYVPATVALVSSSGKSCTYADAYSVMKSQYGLTLHMTGFDIPVESEPVTLPYEYTILDDGTIEITGCDKSATEVVIPSEIDGAKVTSIGSSAFSKCTNLTSIVIPDSVTSIGKWAFLSCESLTSITISDGIKSIGYGAFESCKSLTSIYIPNSVISIGEVAFYGCTSLTEITIPDNVTSIGGDAFRDTPWLKAKKAENPLVIVNNILIDGKNCSGDVVIPDGVTSIDDLTFYFCSELTSITIPESVTHIGRSAFYHSGLESVTIPSSITNIGKEAFASCSELTSVIILGDIASIGDMAFSSCSKLTSITIPDGITNIGSDAFNGTPWLEAKQAENPLVIVNNILINGQTCSGDIIIPDNVTSISSSAFRSCLELTSVIIPNSITSIPFGAFYNCNNLTKIIIPESVTSIGDSAFSCKNLKDITILNPECEIYDGSRYTFTPYLSSVTATIKGYTNSTAQAYAEKYDYKFESLDEAPTLPLGDINDDNLIDAVDATAILSEYAELSTEDGETTFTDRQKKAADVNGDGLVDAVDATFILSYYAELSTGGKMTLTEFVAENNI